jgi:hypothetical protein
MIKYYLLILFTIFPLFASSKNLKINKISSPPIIDGYILKNEWIVTDSATNFVQLEPQKGKPASEMTVTYAVYNDQYIYFAFRCFDQQPEKIVSNIQIRDNLQKSDDVVVVILDTYQDNRSGFAFIVNPLGTQTDMRIADDGRQTDKNWDTQWIAAAQKTDWGWSAEIAIPFSSISYNATNETWGINFGRIIRKNSETSYWSGLMNNDFRVSQGGSLSGIQVPQKEKAITLTPYTTLRFEDSDITGKHNKWFSDIGGDAAYHITSNLIANITYNPDFATVEGDQEKINLTRWELSFPEKRLFFLEGNELYSTRIRTFYSRRIGDVDYGGKIVGKIGDYTVSMLGAKSAEDKRLNYPSAVYSTMRIKKDILKSSVIGINFVDKQWSGGYTRSFSTDYVLNLGNAWKLTGQFVTSAPGDFWKSSAYFVRFARESNIYHYHLRFSDTGENFRDNVNQTGFIRDDDMQEFDSDLSYRWWYDQDLFKYIKLDSRNNIFWNHKGTLRSWFITESVRFYLQNHISLDLSYNNEFKLGDNKYDELILYGKEYYNKRYQFKLGYNTDEWASTELGLTWGKNFGRDFTLGVAKMRARLFRNLALVYEFNILNYSPDPTDKSTIVNILIADYNFTRNLWIRVLAQNNSEEDKVYIYGLFGWRFQPPFGALYLIYTADRKDIPHPLDIERNQLFFLKFSYQIGL